jgi:hypothetical protein
MQKKLLIIGIIVLLICIGLGGCDSATDKNLENRTGMPFLPPDFRVSGLSVESDCGTVVGDVGTAYVNFTVTNHGGAGSAVVHIQVYQGILNFQNCGNGRIYNQTRISYVSIGNDESRDIVGIFPGIDCHNGSNCFGYNYWINT